MTQDLRKKPEVNKPYDYDLDLNWRDDGDILGDASMNDYLKGYKNEPYAFQQWAKNKGINTKMLKVNSIRLLGRNLNLFYWMLLLVRWTLLSDK